MTTHNSKLEGGQHAAAAAAEPVSNTTRYLLIGVLVIAAFFGAYRFADASRPQAATGAGSGLLSGGAGAGGGGCCGGGGAGAPAAGAPAAVAGAAGASAGAAAGGGGGGCCGGGASGPATTGSAKVSGGVQKISVDASRGYNPSAIQLKAGVPAEITFGQSSGCTAIVYSSDLGFQEDLTSGPKTVKLPALQAGTYNFACGMDMVRGTIVVK